MTTVQHHDLLTHGQQLARSARRAPERIALRDGDRTLGYGDLDRRAGQVAGGLEGLGVGIGTRVAILMRNRIEFVEAFLGCARAGAIAVPVNFRLVAAEVAYILRDSGSRVVVVEEDLVDVAQDAIAELVDPPALVVVGAGATPPGTTSYVDLLSGPEVLEEPQGLGERDPLCILYTSGTTGRPKGAVITHLAMAVQSMSRVHAQRLEPGAEVWLSGMQLFHAGALSSLLPCLMIGGEFLMVGPSVDGAQGVVDLMERHGVTSCSLVPTQWQDICAVPGIEERRLSLRTISWGTAPSSGTLLDRMHALFPGVRIYNLFGQTETCGSACTLTGDLAREFPGSVGRPFPNVEMRIVDEHGRDVGTDEVGEVLYRGPTVMREYWNKPEETVAAWAGGWFHSGDLARRDELGLIWVVDRKKDMIISGGENIYSAEVEEAVRAHPKVAEVAVVGVPHERWGETPCAAVVPVDPADPPTLEEVRDHAARHIARYKLPGAVVVVDVLPRTVTGKVQKFVLREQALGS